VITSHEPTSGYRSTCPVEPSWRPNPLLMNRESRSLIALHREASISHPDAISLSRFSAEMSFSTATPDFNNSVCKYQK